MSADVSKCRGFGTQERIPPVTSASIRTMSISIPRMSASISFRGRGGV